MHKEFILHFLLCFLVFLVINKTCSERIVKQSQKKPDSVFDDSITSYYENYDYEDYDANKEALPDIDFSKLELKLDNNNDKYIFSPTFERNAWFEQVWNGSKRLQSPTKTSSALTKNKALPEKLTDKIATINKFVYNHILHKHLHPEEQHRINEEVDSNKKHCTEQYCTSIPDYPKEAIISAVKMAKDIFFYNDRIANPDANFRTGSPNGNNDFTLCEYSEYLIYPKTAKNIDNEWSYIVNTETYTQSIKIERCKQENKPCNVVDGFRLGYETYCKQRYVIRELITFDNKTGQLGKQSFTFPSSCCCSGRSQFSKSFFRTSFFSRNMEAKHETEVPIVTEKSQKTNVQT